MRIKCTVSYDGTAYSGFQVQPEKRTVQSEIEAALAKLHKGVRIKITGSGRTDAGVHAKGQVIHFDTPLNLPEEKWPVALNSLLPGDIAVLKAEKAESGFHARYDAIGKEYRYYILRSRQRDPFLRSHAYQYSFPLDIGRMREGAGYLLGTHDFTSFCAAKTEVEDKVRTLTAVEFLEEGSLLVIRFAGNGFLYNMVRILTGTLLETGRGDREPKELREILAKKDRTAAGKTAPGHGLYLWEVFY
ncbi:tRNA pseudouridine(38-40) synthase TruA [Bacillus sp. FJAT-27251]|uniref:tRNA pseudouridine(38-40) synthase TruA n=1 Tax=Bacillus sp. FJAT-27251 TaxID=1684142 RepID=UPI0006A7C61A|nr:tRNA pseudouridine(38-40) synthase TruA [Bacillus sp. FJAT-27251]